MIRGNWSEAMDARLAAMTANPEGYRLLIHDPEWAAADEADRTAMLRRLAGERQPQSPRAQAIARQIVDRIDAMNEGDLPTMRQSIARGLKRGWLIGLRDRR